MLGSHAARLETGIKQPEALGLFKALRLRCRAAPSATIRADDPNSVFMEKRIG